MGAHTRGSWTAAVLTALLGVGQLGWAVGGDRATTTALVLAPLSLLAAAALARVNCLESRLAVVLVATAPILLTALALTIGLPGQSRQVFDAAALAGLVVPFGVLVAIDADRRIRTRRARTTGSRDDDPWRSRQ
ncbi:hypothetical protein ACFFOS_23480 [Nocardioides kongjuensis]|uniref:Uncharacterized protein n=1 Tax=Nocardioides kongjuensis TaxID=349522 RepID=A0A852RTL3_9ACTN|nr:hypothetical protein [Nocardioides kongjuensis]NYD32200.1 hypothetical protein [Nocardioides kongjuensis]